MPQAAWEFPTQVIGELSHERGRHRPKFDSTSTTLSHKGYPYSDTAGAFFFSTDTPFDSDDPTTFAPIFTPTEGDANYEVGFPEATANSA
jgi:hypothetical protein